MFLEQYPNAKTASPFGFTVSKKESQRIKKKQLSCSGGNSEENKKGNQKAHQGAHQKKAANASGRKNDEKNKNGSNRMQKQLRHSDLLYQKKETQKTKKAAEPLRGKNRRKPKEGNQKAHQGAPQKKAADASGRKNDEKNKNGSNRMQKQLRHSDLLYQK